MPRPRVLAVLDPAAPSDGVRLLPGDAAFLRADDLGALRGDGVFETLHVRGGEPWLVAEHLARLRSSADRLAIPLPSEATLWALLNTACGAWSADVEGVLRVVFTRGPESGAGGPTGYATVAEVSAGQRRGRRDGVTVLTGSLGVPAAARPAAPWLLGGAKTLSYAINMASLRWAAAHGADEMLWISTDGYVLEAPTASLVWLDGDTLCTVPPETTGILPGITARELLGCAGELGWQTAERMVTAAELATAAGAWLTSSVRGVAEIRSIDGVPLPQSPETARIQKLLGFTVA